ncbi:hypothetical protein [Nocardioides abyssi]|uniref:Uncharacterized protein n=1 Tax=Nocardioides abyssi TaxID=3058370 RepID=A0ABT8EXX5_9ACTN|nr:hypothetical protein [Nocardioides abyssi]MDN4162934.1 hypothetical protein [Nocardioides abyssi]
MIKKTVVALVLMFALMGFSTPTAAFAEEPVKEYGISVIEPTNNVVKQGGRIYIAGKVAPFQKVTVRMFRNDGKHIIHTTLQTDQTGIVYTWFNIRPKAKPDIYRLSTLAYGANQPSTVDLFNITVKKVKR